MAKRRWWWSVLYGLHVVHMRFSSVLFSDVHRSNIELLPTTITRKFPTSALNEWNFSHIPQNRLNPRIVSYDCEINASIYRHSSFFVISCSQNYVQRISSSHTDYTRKAVLLLSFRNMACVTSNIQRLLSILHCSNKSINEYQIDRHWFHSAANVSDSCQNYLSKWWLRFFFTIRFQLHCLSANHARSPPPDAHQCKLFWMCVPTCVCINFDFRFMQYLILNFVLHAEPRILIYTIYDERKPKRISILSS